jgi:ABC-2 type transport system ATP-binding protein
MNQYGIVRISPNEIEKIDKNNYIKYLKYKDISLLLVSDKDKFKHIYPNYEIERPSIENIMLVFMRGDKYE